MVNDLNIPPIGTPLYEIAYQKATFCPCTPPQRQLLKND